MLTPIEKLTPLTPLTPLSPKEEPKTKDASQGESVFGAIFRSAIDNVKETDAEKTEAQYLLATGQLDNPAALQIAQEKEGMALDLLIQLRSRALDIYSELNRINL